MTVLVVGSVAYDTIATPSHRQEDEFGGSATFFSLSSSYFSPVSVVAVVGEDFAEKDMKLLNDHGIDTSGIETAMGKTFRWSGVYSSDNLSFRETLDTQLNVFAEFSPKLNSSHKTIPHLFLANIEPHLQHNILQQMSERPNLVALDTMNFWIDGDKDALTKVIKDVDIVFMDEGEAKTFSRQTNLRQAAETIISLGPKAIVIKKGENGVLVNTSTMTFASPAFPVDNLVDPTGAGDSFAGGFIGYLAATTDFSDRGFRRAAVVGTVMGSFAVESFGTERIASLSNKEINQRFRALSSLTQFEPLPEQESLPSTHTT